MVSDILGSMSESDEKYSRTFPVICKTLGRLFFLLCAPLNNTKRLFLVKCGTTSALHASRSRAPSSKYNNYAIAQNKQLVSRSQTSHPLENM